MTYDDLPYAYKEWAAKRFQEQSAAVSAWEQGKDYREFVENRVLHMMKNHMGTETVVYLDTLLVFLRGKRGELV